MEDMDIGKVMMKLNYKTITEKINTKFLKHSAVNKSDELFQVLEKLKPSGICVELGTYKGISTLVLSNYFEFIFTYDVVDYKERIEIWETFDVFHYIDTFIFENRKLIRKDLLEAVQYFEIDWSFIDTIHDYKNVKAEVEMMEEINCKNILIHDIHLEGVKKYFEERKGKVLSEHIGYLKGVNLVA